MATAEGNAKLEAAKKMFQYVTKQQWDKVVEEYRTNHYARECIMNSDRDSILHLLVMGGDKDHEAVMTLLGVLRDEVGATAAGREAALGRKNHTEDTPMHMACMLGLRKEAVAMAGICPELVAGARNKRGETPLFMVSNSGDTGLFLDLLRAASVRKDVLSAACIREDTRDSIIHVAIYRDHLELALLLIRLFRDTKVVIDNHEVEFINLKNKKEKTALSILATKPHLFKSGTRLGFFHNLFYKCLPLKLNDSKLPNYDEGLISIPQGLYDSMLWQRGEKMMKLNKIKTIEMKRKHMHAKKILELLVESATDWRIDAYENEEMNGVHPNKRKGSPFLSAVRKGIIEMVEEIHTRYPLAIHDMNTQGNNAMVLAITNRQSEVYDFLRKKPGLMREFRILVDESKNSLLHVAAKKWEKNPIISGAALQLQWDIKWYEFVKATFDVDYKSFFELYNEDHQTPMKVFVDEHKEMVKEGAEWLKDTSTACSVVAALIATVAYTSAVTVPGGVKPESGTPTLEQTSTFAIFTMATLFSLCFSVTSLVLFLSILTTRCSDKDFKISLPMRLLLGLTSLFCSIGAMLVTFCASHFFILEKKVKYVAIPLYAVTCLPASIFALLHFRLYIDLVQNTFSRRPLRAYERAC